MNGYRIVKVVVSKANYDSGVIEFTTDGEDPNINHVMTLHGIGRRGISFMTPYTTNKIVDADNMISGFLTKNSMNFASGVFVNPNVGDKMLVAVYFHQSDLMLVQHNHINVIILGYIQDEFHFGNSYLFGMIHQSGAGLQINHAWLDKNTTTVDDRSINILNGHITLVGNRSVFLYGKKFLPFGGLSHQYTINNKKVKQMENDGIVSESWSEVFSNDITKSFVPDFKISKVVSSTTPFLDPPCPDEGEMMQLHDSGWKLHVNTSGHELKAFTSKLELRGSYYNQYSFDPTNSLSSITSADQTLFSTSFTDAVVIEASSFGTTPETEVRILNKAFFGSEERILKGYYLNITTSLPAGVQAAITSLSTTESGKYKLVIGGTTFTIDGTANTVVINNGTVSLTMSGGTVNVA